MELDADGNFVSVTNIGFETDVCGMLEAGVRRAPSNPLVNRPLVGSAQELRGSLAIPA